METNLVTKQVVKQVEITTEVQSITIDLSLEEAAMLEVMAFYLDDAKIWSITSNRTKARYDLSPDMRKMLTELHRKLSDNLDDIEEEFALHGDTDCLGPLVDLTKQ